MSKIMNKYDGEKKIILIEYYSWREYKCLITDTSFNAAIITALNAGQQINLCRRF